MRFLSLSLSLALCVSVFLLFASLSVVQPANRSESPPHDSIGGRSMGLSAAAAAAAAAMSLAVPAATVLRSPRSPLFSSTSLSSAATVAVGRFLSKSSSVVVGEQYYAFRRSSGAAAGLKSSATFSSSAASSADCRSSAAALRLRRGCPNCGLQTRRSFRAFATMASESPESAANNPGLHETPDEATKGYFLQQTMYRIKDPKVSLDFYTRILGMSLLKRFDFPEGKFSLYFVGFEDAKSAPTDPSERIAWTFGKTGTLELTHNWGTESDENFKGHHNGNSDPRGYGHIGITVDDTYKACERFEKLGVKFVKKPDDGKMKGLAFIQDPDGYWIEIFDVKNMSTITAKA